MRVPPGQMSFAGAFPANPTASPASDKEPATPGGSGRNSRASSRHSAPTPCSSKTCLGSGEVVCETCWPTLPLSGSMRSGRASEQATSEHLTAASDSSCWPTPTACEYGSSQNGIGGACERPSAHTPSLYTIARQWPTPTANLEGRGARSAEATARRFKENRGRGANLHDFAALWPTPTARDQKGEQAGFTREGGAALPDAVRATWPTPTAGDARSSGSRNLEGSKANPGVSLTDAVTAGTSTVSRRGQRGSPDGMVLNPRFVEAMMGFPDGRTACVSSVTRASRSKLRAPGKR